MNEVTQWMASRRRDVEELNRTAEQTGHQIWAAATRLGQNIQAPRPQDVLLLGARLLAQPSPTAALGTTIAKVAINQAAAAPSARTSTQAPPKASVKQSASRPASNVQSSVESAPPAEDISKLREQQAEFRDVVKGISRDNAWMAAAALAPVAVIAAVEAPAVVATRFAPPAPFRPPLNLTGREPYLRVGDNYATRIGRLAHRNFKELIEGRAEKGGEWKYEPRLKIGDRAYRPDARTGTGKYYLELKPDTPSGRAAGLRALQKYQQPGGKKTRFIYYDPKKIK